MTRVDPIAFQAIQSLLEFLQASFPNCLSREDIVMLLVQEWVISGKVVAGVDLEIFAIVGGENVCLGWKVICKIISNYKRGVRKEA